MGFISKFFKKAPQQNAVKASGLYLTPTYRPSDYFPRFYGLTDTEHSVNPTDRRELVASSREITSRSGIITQAIEQKTNWSFNPSAWNLEYYGEDKGWGALVCKWYNEQWMNSCNVRGQQFHFKASLRNISRSLLTDGEILLVWTETKDGYPMFRLIHSDRIGSPWQDDVVKEGRYKGFKLFDGCIMSEDTGRSIAYNVMGKDPNGSDAVQIDARDCYLIFDPKTQDRNRGIPPMASAILDAYDYLDIRKAQKQTVKLESKIGVIVTNEMGSAPVGSYLDPLTMQSMQGSSPACNTSCDDIARTTPYGRQAIPDGANLIYLKAGLGEKYEAFLKQNPHGNALEFTRMLEKAWCASIGWPWEVVNPDLAKPGMAGIAENVRNEIDVFQSIVEKPMNMTALITISKAMELGIIPNNENGDWRSFRYSLPAEFTLDAKYSHQIFTEQFKLGQISMQDWSNRYGRNWIQTRNQIQDETVDIVSRAVELNKQFPQLSVDYFINFIEQRYANPPASPTITIPNEAQS